MKTRRIEDLRVYALVEKLADEVWMMVLGWDKFRRQTLGGQPVRAADSVGANIAEGTGRGSFQDNRRFIRVARGSPFETRHWLRRAYSRQLVSSKRAKSLKITIHSLGPQLNAYLKSIGPTNDQGRMTSDK